MATGSLSSKSSEQLKVGVVDYGMGNIHSVVAAVELFGHAALLSDDPEILGDCDRLILPGVGSFFRAMENIRLRGLDVTIPMLVNKGKPLLGICLGMQLLAEAGTEDGESKGLGLIPGKVRKLAPNSLPVPHVGFGTVSFTDVAAPYNELLGGNADFYFVHSFYFDVSYPEHIAGQGVYGQKFAAFVRNGNVLGTQFHPEKSQSNGLKFLKLFFQRGDAVNA